MYLASPSLRAPDDGDQEQLSSLIKLIILKGAVEEPESIGEAAEEIRNALRENAAMRKANAEVKSLVLAVKEKAAQIEAMPKFKSGTDKERS